MQILRRIVNILLLLYCAYFVKASQGNSIINLDENNWRIVLENEWMIEL